MKKKIKSKKVKATPKRKVARKVKPKAKKSDGKVTIHPSGKDVRVSPARAAEYRLQKRTT